MLASVVEKKTFHLCFTKYSKVKKVAFYHCWVLLLSVLSILISFYNLLSSILLRKIGKLKWSQFNPIKYLNISEYFVTLVISKPVQSIWITENDLYKTKHIIWSYSIFTYPLSGPTGMNFLPSKPMSLIRSSQRTCPPTFLPLLGWQDMV